MTFLREALIIIEILDLDYKFLKLYPNIQFKLKNFTYILINLDVYNSFI